MVIFDIDGKKILKVSLQMELDSLDEKIARVLTARNELHQAICELFNDDWANVDGWSADSLPNIKATVFKKKEQDALLDTERLVDSKIAVAKKEIIDNITNAFSTSKTFHIKLGQEHET